MKITNLRPFDLLKTMNNNMYSSAYCLVVLRIRVLKIKLNMSTERIDGKF